MLSVAQGAGVIGRIGWGALADRSGRPLLVLAFVAAGMAVGALSVTYFGVLVTPPLFAVAIDRGAGFGWAYTLLALPALASALWLWRWHGAALRAKGANSPSRSHE